MEWFKRMFRSRSIKPAETEDLNPYVVCEHWVGITTHLRLRSLSPLKYGGGLKVQSLCGLDMTWDTKQPVSSARCGHCIAERYKAEDTKM